MTERLTKREYFEDPTLPLQVHIRDPQPAFPLHSHGFDELVIILKGTGLHVVDGQEMPVKSGDVLVVAGAHMHEYKDMHGLALANILFDAGALGMAQWDVRALPGFHALFELEPLLRSQQKFTNRLRLTERQLQHAGDLLSRLTRETAGRKPGYRVMATGLFMELTVFLSRCYSERPDEGSIELLRIGDAIAHIETNFQQKISLEELAQKAHLSPRQFQRVFLEYVGRSPIDYLLHVRVNKAAELLRNTDRTITDIAFDCGFHDGNYLTRCFRKIMDQTPGQYRRAAP
jgi:AraC-like DNA-binding protein